MLLLPKTSQLPDDPILGLIPLYNQDPRPEKMNLAIGGYKDGNGLPVVMNAVRKAELALYEQHLNKEYLPIDGDPLFRSETIKLIFGQDSSLIPANSIHCAQTIGASGALTVGAEFLKELNIHSIAISDPTWTNHSSLFHHAGLQITEYSYYDRITHEINFEKMCDSINRLPQGTAILLQTCCHNPTGCDPTEEQWEYLSSLIDDRGLFPFFDCAYQGFDRGIAEDTRGIRIFTKKNIPLCIAYSYSKNFGLYGERVGALCTITGNSDSIEVRSHINRLIRGNYSSPPLQGARIVTTILTNPELKNEWNIQLDQMRERIYTMRLSLADKLAKKISEDFDFVKKQRGMFGFIKTNPDQIMALREQYGIYMPLSGRISIPGLTEHNIDAFVDALKNVF